MSEADFQTLLVETSRTFALSIPLLPEPLRHQVTIAYLLFRIADTLEDATLWPRERRASTLEELRSAFTQEATNWENLAESWRKPAPHTHAGYLRLLDATSQVVGELRKFDRNARAAILTHVTRTAAGMAEFQRSASPEGDLNLQTLADLRHYCYIVAGIVGEMLTELFLLAEPTLREQSEPLRQRARAFGEGLQLVNILKDSADDARHGRVYLPSGVDRGEVFHLARIDLTTALEYVDLLRKGGASAGVVGFTGLPVRLAFATLERVERDGPGAKLTRAEVLHFFQEFAVY
jgi:farnesyl-diphosphate farnesyltransferase